MTTKLEDQLAKALLEEGAYLASHSLNGSSEAALALNAYDKAKAAPAEPTGEPCWHLTATMRQHEIDALKAECLKHVQALKEYSEAHLKQTKKLESVEAELERARVREATQAKFPDQSEHLLWAKQDEIVKLQAECANLRDAVVTLELVRNKLQRELYPMHYKLDETKVQQNMMDETIFEINDAIAKLNEVKS